jgi:hypothetical protein
MCWDRARIASNSDGATRGKRAAEQEHKTALAPNSSLSTSSQLARRFTAAFAQPSRLKGRLVINLWR